jgi:hypothetical protein
MNCDKYAGRFLSGAAFRSGRVHGAGFHHGAGSMMEAHLSEDQIDEKLIGTLAPIPAAHLAECELCVSRVTAAAEPIEAFKAVTAAWSERRSATLPLHQSVATSASFHPRLAWAAVVGVALAIGVTIPVVSHQERHEAAQKVQAPAAIADIADNSASGDAEIVRDNQMLKAIDRELDTTVESPEALGLRPVSGAAAQKAERPSSVKD